MTATVDIDKAARLKPTPENASAIEEGWRASCPDSFLIFAYGLTIDSATGPRCFQNCITQFQRDAFEDVAPALEAIRDGKPPPPPYNRFWWERTKKAGKDSDLAICVMWLAAFATRPFYGQIGAGDSKQAGIVKERVSNLLQYNPWLNDSVELVQSQIRSKTRRHDGSPLACIDIMTTESKTGHGGLPDIMIINELTHMDKWAFAETLMANAAGVPRGIVIIATNAGIIGSDAERWRDNAYKNKNWAVRIWDRVAPWLNKQLVEEQKQQLRTPECNRLWKGWWISGTGDALSEDQIDRCFVRTGPLEAPEQGWAYIGGLDLGVSHDHCGAVILGVNDVLQKIRVAWFRGFEPEEDTGEIDLINVEETFVAMCKVFHVQWMGYDPAAGGSFMAQRMRMQGINAKEVSFGSPTNRTQMAEAMVQVFEARSIECYDDADGRLRRDFGKFNIKEKPPFGCQLVAVSDVHGHADVGTALVICLPRARDMIGLLGTFGFVEGDVIAARGSVSDDRSTKEKRDDLPDDLAGIYDLHDKIERAGGMRAYSRRRGNDD